MWYEIKMKADKAEVWIYDQIGEDFWSGGGVTAKSFQKELSAIKASQIDLHINSPGGSVFDGVAIYNLLKNHAANVTTFIDGIAASIASVIALAGDKVVMAANALYMIHNPTGVVVGSAKSMRETADILDKVRDTMANVYVKKTKTDPIEMQAMMEAETWMTADEALAAGFIDEVSDEMDIAACVKFIPAMSKAGFKHIPNELTANKSVPSQRHCERALRDAGCTKRDAQAILAKGYPGEQRDVVQPEPAATSTDQRDVTSVAPAAVIEKPAPVVPRWMQLVTQAETLS